MILYLCNVCVCVPWSAICVSVLEGKVKKIVSNASIKFSAMVIISSALLQSIKNCGCVCVCVCMHAHVCTMVFYVYVCACKSINTFPCMNHVLM